MTIENNKIDFTNKNQFQIEFYNQLTIAKGGLEQKEGATMKSAMALYLGSTLELFGDEFTKLNFSKPEDLNAYCISFINKYATKFINGAVKLSYKDKLKKLKENEKDNKDAIDKIKEEIQSQLVVSVDTMKKDNHNLLRVLRDCLPVAFYLIASSSPIEQGDENTKTYYTSDGKLLVNNTHSNAQADMKVKFKLTQMYNACNFEDLKRMSSYWFFGASGSDKTKTGVQNIIAKLREKIGDAVDFGAKGKEDMISNTLNDIVSLVIENIDTLDEYEEYSSIDEIIEHIQALSGYGAYNGCTNTHTIKKDKEGTIKNFGKNRVDQNENGKLELSPVTLIGNVPFSYDKEKNGYYIIQKGNAKNILGVQPVYTKTGTSKQ